jgi:hypothetical protein
MYIIGITKHKKYLNKKAVPNYYQNRGGQYDANKLTTRGVRSQQGTP